MVTVSKATAADNIWETIYDLINTNVSDPNPPDEGTRKWIFSSFPDGKIEPTAGVTTKAKDLHYPLIVIEAPQSDWEKLTMKKRWVNTRILVSAFSTSKKQSITLMDSILDTLETNRPSLRDVKLVKFMAENVENDVQFRDEIKVHVRNAFTIMKFSFKGTL